MSPVPSTGRQLPGPTAMLGLLNEIVAKGYQISAVTELQFEGPIPKLTYAEVAIDQPDARTVLPVLMPHGGHWHLYIYTLVKTEALTEPVTSNLTDQILTALASMSMDERASVSDEGHA